MAESKGTAEDAEESHGEFLNLRNVEDSGIESGEDLRVNPEVMKEVEDALGRLESILVGLDAPRRQAVSKLVNSLQSCLRLPPKRRATVGVTSEELAAARKWLNPPLEEMTLEYIVYRPIAQRPGFLMEPAPQSATLSYIPKSERSLSDSSSIQDYDPSILLFTPEETVQIAIHKAAINKQISQEEKRRESSEDGDVSSADEETAQVNKFNEVSSAQRLLQLASENAKKNPSAARFHNRSSKKLKMKRANTIDIPKPANFYEYSSGDEYGASADEVNPGFEKRRTSKDNGFLPPTFVPKTENDLKFLAFLKQVNDNQPKVQTYNPSARGGKHWSNRFSSIKTTFEHAEPKQSAAPSPAKMFWQNNDSQKTKNDQYKTKLPWTVKTDNDGVVVGSLTVAKPGVVNNFNHAPKSAFKPIEKKTVSTVSGTVKQIATQKFSVNENDYDSRIEKTVKKIPTMVNSSHLKHNNVYNNFKEYSTPPPTRNNISGTSHAVNHPNNLKHSNNHTSSSKPVKSIDHSLISESSKVKNDNYNPLQKSFVPEPRNKVYDSNTNTKIGQSDKTSNTGHDPLSRTQQNTLAAKKQFMEMKKSQVTTEHNNPNSHIYIDPQPVYNRVNNSQIYYKTDLSNTNFSFNGSQHTNSQTNYKYPSSNKPEIHPKPKIIDSGFHTDESSYKSTSNTNVIQKPVIVRPNPLPAVSRFQNLDRSHQDESNGHHHKTKQNSSYYPHNFKESYVQQENVYSGHHNDGNYKQTDTVDQYDRKGVQNSFEYRDYYQKPEPVEYRSSPGPKDRSYTAPHSGNILYDSQDYYHRVNEDTNRSVETSCVNSPNLENKPYTTYIYSSNNTVSSSNLQESASDSSINLNEKSNYLLPTINPASPFLKEEPLSPPSNLATPNSLERLSPSRPFHTNKPVSDQRYLSPSYHSGSAQKYDDDEISWGSAAVNGDDSPLEEKAVSRVMGQAQCQQAITVNNRTRRRFDLDIESELKLQLKQSAQKKSLSPSFPNVLQKSESWHQMVKEQMQQAKQAPPLPKISKAKSSHSLAQPKQFEAALAPDSITQKKITVSQYLQKQQARSVKSTKSNPKYKSTNTLNINNYSDDLEDVDEVFETIFQEASKKRNSK